MFRFEQSLLNGLVPISLFIVSGFIAFIMLVYAYKKIRPKFPVRVTCWFCHKKSDVPYDNRNCWDCAYCEQYNGFAMDGGYNKVIPAQHDELLNHPITVNSSFTKKKLPTASENVFCRKCTINQELKIHQLASFTPRDPGRFDHEVEEYRQHLERAYQLCDHCEHILKKVLQKQQGWLLDQHRKQQLVSHLKPNVHVFSWWHWSIPVFWLQWTQVASAVIAFSLVMTEKRDFFIKHFSQYMSPDLLYILEEATNYDHIVTSSTACIIILITGCSENRRRVDIISCVLWFVMFIHKWLLLWPYLNSKVSEEDLKMGHIIVVLLTFLVNVVAVVSSRYIYPPKKLMLKKLKMENNRTYRGRNITEQFKSPCGYDPDPSSDKLSSTCSSETSNSSTSAASSSWCGSLQRSPPCYPNLESDSAKNSSIRKCSSAGDLEWRIEKLNLGQSSQSKNDSIFKFKSYSTGSFNNGFHASGHNNASGVTSDNRNSHLIRPSRLNFRRNVTQTSWVAGGYWRELGGSLSKAMQAGRSILETGFQAPGFCPMSRSSSQSSGFHSNASYSPTSSPHSYCGSQCGGGDGDHCSELTEPISFPTCSAGEHFHTSIPKVPFVTMPYYGEFSFCGPQVCRSSALGNFNHHVPFFISPLCSSSHKHHFSKPCCRSSIAQMQKHFTYSVSNPLDKQSTVGSSINSGDKQHFSKEQKKSVQNTWKIMKQNMLLSILCLGSIFFNIIGIVLFIHTNKFTLQT